LACHSDCDHSDRRPTVRFLCPEQGSSLSLSPGSWRVPHRRAQHRSGPPGCPRPIFFRWRRWDPFFRTGPYCSQTGAGKKQRKGQKSRRRFRGLSGSGSGVKIGRIFVLVAGFAARFVIGNATGNFRDGTFFSATGVRRIDRRKVFRRGIFLRTCDIFGGGPRRTRGQRCLHHAVKVVGWSAAVRRVFRGRVRSFRAAVGSGREACVNGRHWR